MPTGGAGNGAGGSGSGAGGSSPGASGAAAGETADAGGPNVADASGDLGAAPSDAVAAGDAHAPYPPRRSPNEVLVVYNANSPISTAVANDYAQKRMVTNVISVNCADSAISSNNETISISDYTSKIATPISQYLASHSNVNFIVLTKGVPIRIDGAMTGCCVNDTGGRHEPSLDSYLAAIDYPTISGAKMIGITGSGTVGSGWLNRYWNATVPFSHAQFGGYLVTRLDGYTQTDALALVTRALAAEQTPPTGKVLLDVPLAFGLSDKSMQPAAVTDTITQESSYDTWNADMLHAHDLIEASGIPNELDLVNTFIGGRSNLAAYFSWGSNDPHFDPSAYLSLSFGPGSISDTAVSTSARTFLPTSGGQSLLVDLIAHGLTAGKGYVGVHLLQGIASPSITLARYESGYSMAESLYAASRFVGWEDVVIGDPLCTPQFGRGPLVVPIQAGSFDSSSGGSTRKTAPRAVPTSPISTPALTRYTRAFP